MLILTRTPALSYLDKVTVAEITTHIRKIPVELPLGSREGLSRECVANLDNLHTVPKDWLAARAGTLSRKRIGDVKRCLGWAFDLQELKYSSG